MTSPAITFLQPYPDARSDKLARGLAAAGVAVRRVLLDFDASWQVNFSVGDFESVIRLPELVRRHQYVAAAAGLAQRSIRKAIEALPGTVVRTSTPDLIGASGIRTSKRIVAEVYDAWSLYDAARSRTLSGLARRFSAGWAERRVHERADLIVYTSQAMLAWAQETYRIPRAIVVPNAVLSQDLPQQRLPKLSEDGGSHCVYVGYLSPSGESASRSLLPYFRDLAREHTVHVYGVTERGKESAVRAELNGVAVWHNPVPQRELLVELTQYDFGLILLPRVDVRRFETVLPNKLFEYACAGIPVLVSPFKAMVDFVRTYRCGSVVGEGIPSGDVPLRPEFLLDTYLADYRREIERLGA